MSIYYVDPDANGANDGTSKTDAWTDAQSAFDTAVAGDLTYLMGIQVLSSIIDIDTNSGNGTDGMIRFVGVNSDWVNNGERFVLIGGAVDNCLKANGVNFIHLENIELITASGNGLEGIASSQRWVFNNCSFNNNGGYGANLTLLQTSFFIRCTFYSNGSDGAFKGFNNRYLFCSFRDNTGSGHNAGGIAGMVWIGCLSYDNGEDGLMNMGNYTLAFNHVINNNTDDGVVGSGSANILKIVIGSRITNQSGSGDIGLNCNNRILYHGWNYYEDNDGDNIQNNSIALEILNDGASTDVEDQANINEGYTDLTDNAQDFSLRDDASARRTAITIPRG